MKMHIRSMNGKMYRELAKRTLTFFLCVSILALDFAGIGMWLMPPPVLAAHVIIDNSANATAAEQTHSGSQTVFVSDQTGYKFYGDSTGICVYSKTTDGGASWGSAVTIDSQTDCDGMAVWYDQWTPNSTGTTIHIVTMDTSSNNDNLFYNALDTSDDTRLTGAAAINTDPGNGQTYTLVSGANYPSITKATNGTVYITVNDSSDSAVLRCSTTCGTGTNWTEAGTNPYTNANDYSVLVALTGGDIMTITRVIGVEDIKSKKWNNGASAWDAAWTNIDLNAFDNATYDVGLAVTVASSSVAATSTVYLAYIADNNDFGTADHDVRVGRYSAGLWATSTSASPAANVLTDNAKGLTSVAIGHDTNTNDVYVAYSGRSTIGTAGTANVYWKVSSTSMATWSAESSGVGTTTNDIYGVDLTVSSNQRMYTTWYGVTGTSIFGETIADLVPGVRVSTTSSQITQTTASTSNVYIGGTFALTEYLGSRDVTGVTIEESGTVDAQNALSDIKLYYESDTQYPYDCASVAYGTGGSETQFGSTDTNGFSGADGSSGFTTGASVTVSTTSALCFYVVMTVLDTAANNSTINIRMANPSTDVTVTGGGEVAPATTLDLTGSTTVKNDIMTQTHFHFRSDTANEATAPSRTGGVEDTVLAAIQQSTPLRIRLGLSNEGGTTSPAMQYRLEYSLATSTCSAAYLWTDVGATADEWDMYNSTNLTDGANTTNIANATGGVTDENTSFIVANAGVKDTSSQTAAITATSTQFFELEYSVVASTTAAQGNSYCFRVTNAGTELPSYLQYPKATIAADVTVSATSSQIAQMDVPSTNTHIGGGFVVVENASSRTVDSITLTENGTVDAATGLDEIKLLYELDTVAPYDCTGMTYGGGETPYGTTDSDGFSSANGTSTFEDTVTITTTQALCLYVVINVTTSASNGQTINVSIAQPSVDVVVSGGGSVAPSTAVDITASTSLRGPVLTQTHYHWRNDNGSESGASSATGGTEDTALASLQDGTPIRLRTQVSNEGATTSYAVQYLLEYSTKVTTCSAATGWTDVGAGGGAFDMYNSTNLTDGANTTNIAVGSGGVTDENASFLSSNAGVKDTSSLTSAVAPTSTQFVEFEFSIEQTANAGYSIPYCFRLTNNGTALDVYSVYPELTTAPQRDFKVQRGTSTISGTSVTITAGTDYVAPAASTSAFIRITNSHHTGAGNTAGSNTQDADNVTAYIQDASNILTSVTFARAGTAISNTRVYWEIVEFIGATGTDNEMRVRQQQAVTYVATSTIATATAATGVVSDSDIVVFVTGMMVPDGSDVNYNTGLATAAWASTTDQAVFTRGEANSIASVVSYAVVEFVGGNWLIQRAEHTYSSTVGATETEDISSVNSLARTFIHTQKRVGAGLEGLDEFGHEVWLSSVGQLSLKLESGATTPSGQVAVVWVIENLQTSTGAMTVTRSNNFSVGGAEPLTSPIEIGTTLSDVTNASIFINNRAADTGTNYPRPILGAVIASTTHYFIWRSDTVSRVDYRTEIVEWPVAGLAFRQNDYRLFVDNNALEPTDPWGTPDIGENTSITANDQPPGDGEVVRIRMSIAISNATFPTTTQAFKLQYGTRVSSCSAIATNSWYDLGDAASSTVWRGFAATGTTDGTALSGNPATLADFALGVSDVAGTLEEENTSVANPYSALDGQDVEYDWFVQLNGATGGTTYCFRMVKADGIALDGYNDYPQIRSASFSPETQNWQWFEDEANETPVNALGLENITPIDVSTATTVKLRVTVKETKNISLDDVRFKLQFSEYSDFSTSSDVVATSSCVATSTWCYADGGGADNSVITTKKLSDVDACVAGVGDGCGTHNESPTALTGFRHEGGAAAEYEFTIQSAAPRVNRVYYFRLYDLSQSAAVVTGSGESYPSLTTEGAHLVFSTTGLATSTVTEGVTTDIATTPGAVNFGTLTPGALTEAAQRFSVTTNATEGYQLLMYSRAGLVASNGETIPYINASNTAPAAWATACDANAAGCYGYHSGDDILSSGSSRFSPNDSYAAFESAQREVGHSSIPVTNDTVDMVYRVLARDLQPAGQYETDIVFVSIPSF